MTPYEEPATPVDLHDDCLAVGRNLGLERVEDRWERATRAAVAPAPSLLYADYPTEVTKREIRVDDAARRIAAALFD